MTPIELVLSKLSDTTPRGNGLMARCPAHNDRSASLSVNQGDDGRVLLNCFAGCSHDAVVGAMGLESKDLFVPRDSHNGKPHANGHNSAAKKPAAATAKEPPRRFASWKDEIASLAQSLNATVSGRWQYDDAAGNPLTLVTRFNSADGSKTFRPITKHIKGGYTWTAPDGNRPLYRLLTLASATTVYWCEGEKAALAAMSLGIIATTSMGGSNAPELSDYGPIKGKTVVILPDNDEAGRKYAETVARLCHEAGALSVKIVELPGLPPKGDIVEWIESHGDAAEPESMRSELESLVDAAPIYVAQTASTTPITTTSLATVQQLPAGTSVRANDQGHDNFGTVVSDDGGATVTVHFKSPEGHEKTVDIFREQLKTADGMPLVPSNVPAIVIRPAGQLIGEFPEMRPAILEGLLRRGETMNIIAAPKTGKSWLSMGLALCVVCELKWLGRFWTRRGKVLIVDNELHPETSAHRLPRIAEAMGIQHAEYDDGLFVANLRGQLTDLHLLSAQLNNLELGAFDLIILDAWYRFQPVGTDENSNGDVTALYNLLDSVADKIGSAFVCIHHTSKGNQSGKGVTDVGSGAGAQSRAPDTHLTIRPHEEDNAVVVEAAVRSFAPPDPFCLRWNFPIWTAADDLDPKDLRQERPRKAKGSASGSDESPDDSRQRRDQEARQKVLDAYAIFPSGETARAIREAAGMSGAVFGPVNSELIRVGIVQTCKVEKSGRLFDGFRLTSKPLGQVGQVGQNDDLSHLSDRDREMSGTSRPPLGAAVCPTHLPVSDASNERQSEWDALSQSQSSDDHEMANELFSTEAV